MSYTSQSMTVNNLMANIGEYYLPAIQREFVWPTAKIEALFDSLLRGYPIGTLLLWDVTKPAIHEFQFYELIRDFDVRDPHNVKANLNILERCRGVLDGQQRITSLNIGLRGSYIEKLPRLWVTNPNAYPRMNLYINLLFTPNPSEDGEQQFQIKFLPEDKVKTASQAYWFPVSNILRHKTRDELRSFRRSTPHKDNDVFENNLDRLWTAIHEQQSIHYFLEPSNDLDRVLRIFHRLNTGGAPLEHADLLLSLATATWTQHDAREQVYALVDDLNRKCGTFAFSKNFVLKALLVCSDRDVRFRAENIGRQNRLEAIWESVKTALTLTARLLTQFGLTYQTLPAPNAAIAIAYYIFKRGLNESFLQQKTYQDDRETIRVWLLQVQLGRVFSGQTDRVLTIIRTAMQEAQTGPLVMNRFPAEEIYQALQAIRPLAFTEEYIRTIVAERQYGDADAFAIMALLFPYLRFNEQQYHLDHLHPQALFTKEKLAASGMTPADVEFALAHFNGLPNLQLLPGSINIAKKDKALAEWLQPDSYEGADVKRIYREWCLVPDTDLKLAKFKVFYQAREALLVQALKNKLGYASADMLESVESDDMLMTGDDSTE